jgi:hypothetical protein
MLLLPEGAAPGSLPGPRAVLARRELVHLGVLGVSAVKIRFFVSV